MNLRVPCSFLVKKLFGTGVDTCNGFLLAWDLPALCTTVGTCGSPAGVLWSSSGGSATDADTTFKINRFKQSYFPASSLASSDYDCIIRLPLDLSTGHDYLDIG